MPQQFKEFQINGYTKRSHQAFLDVTNAEYQTVEDWKGAYTSAGMDVAGWRVTDIPSKHLNRLADRMEVALICFYPVEILCTPEKLSSSGLARTKCLRIASYRLPLD